MAKTYPLASTDPTTFKLPEADPTKYPTFWVPSHTTKLTMAVRSQVPLLLAMGYTNPEASGYVGPPDPVYQSASSGDPAARVSAQASELTPSLWACYADPRGPFKAKGVRLGASATCAASSVTDQFDMTMAPSTGDFWLRAMVPGAPAYRPLVLQPGQSGQITLTITPTARPRTKVSGFVSVESWDPQTTESEEIVDVPYTYRVG